MRTFDAPDGARWGVEVRAPGASNAMIVFRHPRSSTLNRYAWLIWQGPESRSVTSRLVPKDVLATVTDADLSRLFRRSMPISPSAPAASV